MRRKSGFLMIVKWSLDYPAYTGTEKRNAYVYLPVDYETDPKQSYPVLYMFDGHNVFYDKDATYGKSWGMAEYLDAVKAPLIVAAVECNHSPEGGRLSEYSPYDYADRNFGFITGRGRETMDWFIRVFKPYIDRKYRTLSDRKHTFLAGSSMGGLMTIYAVLQYNNIFSRGAALSPYVSPCIEELCTLVRGANIGTDTVLYVDYGDCEFDHSINAKHDYASLIHRLLRRHIQLTSRIIPNGTHCEASWEKQLPFFISTLLYEVT